MKPLDGTFAENAERWGVAGLNVDGGRVAGKLDGDPNRFAKTDGGWGVKEFHSAPVVRNEGRWPANLILDEEAAGMLDGVSGASSSNVRIAEDIDKPGATFALGRSGVTPRGVSDSGGASRFFYVAKSARAERNEGCEDQPDRLGGGLNATVHGDTRTGRVTIQKNNHPTVKPLSLMKYLCQLTRTPTGGIVLDPFAGSGTTLWAAEFHNRPWLGIELSEEYVKIAEARIARERSQLKMAI
jgi:site-specific DNA-methyltransferase (adenine-specific)